VKKVFNVKQTKAIDLLAKGDMKNQEIASELRVTPSTVSKWKQMPGFMEEVIVRSKKLLKESLPNVYKALTSRSELGSDRHIKIYLDHLEKLEEIKAGRTSVTFTWQSPTTTEAKDE